MGSPGDPRKKEEREEREKRRKRKERKAREREEIVARKSEARHNRRSFPPALGRARDAGRGLPAPTPSPAFAYNNTNSSSPGPRGQAKGPGGHAVPRGAWATVRGAGAAGKGQGSHFAFDQACTHLRLRFRLVLREFQRARLLRFRECARSRRARFFAHPPTLLFLGSGEVRSGGNAAQRERGSSGPCTGCGARTTGAHSLPRICL